jgi:SSS family solute:Na+ symporter
MYSGSLALATMGGWNFYVTIAVLGVVATLYTYYGGLEGVVWTDVLQSLMLFGGAAAIVLYVWLDTGTGPATWWAAAGEQSADRAPTPVFSLDPRVRMTMLTAMMSGFFWQICTHCSDQVVLQRYASTPSLAAARGSYITNLIALLAITSFLAMSGLALFYYYFVLHPDRLPPGASLNTVGDKLMPHFYATQLPLGFGGLILANFLCDAMQTLVSGVNSITAVATQDVLQHSALARDGVPSKLGVARKLTLVLGLLTTLIAITVAFLSAQSGRNIFDLMPKTFNMFIGPLGALFLMGMFLPRVTGRTAVPSVLAAVAVSVIWNYWKAILSVPAVWSIASRWFAEPFDLSIMWSYGVACVSGLFFAFVFSLLFERGGEHPGQQYTWWAVMKRPLPSPST